MLGRAVIENVYPRLLGETTESSPEREASISGEPALTVTSLREGGVLALDIDGLVSLARRADCAIELVPQVGDFLAIGDPAVPRL